MPEGHLIHHTARQHARLAGGVVEVTSPQGRFADGAARLDGATLEAVEARGKHLFYRWSVPELLHVHLGKQGLTIWHDPPPPLPRPQVRVRLAADAGATDVIAPRVCELLSEEAWKSIAAGLGPDPLRGELDVDDLYRRLSRSDRPVGVLLMDQSVVAGVGNVLRAEVLFAAGIHPERRGSDLDQSDVERLADALVRIMRRAAAEGTIRTREDADSPLDARFVYKRDRCARCGTSVDVWDLQGRTAYACPRCQPGPTGQTYGKSSGTAGKNLR